MVTTQHKSKAMTQNIKKKKKEEIEKNIVATKEKWQTEAQGKINKK